MASRLVPRTTRESRPAACRWRGRCGPRSAGRPGAAGRPGRWTGRRPCRPPPGRPRPDQTARRARPRPLASRWTARTAGSSRGQAGGHGQRGVGAGVVGDGDPEREREVPGRGSASSRRTHGSRSASSLWTGTATSSTARWRRAWRLPPAARTRWTWLSPIRRIVIRIRQARHASSSGVLGVQTGLPARPYVWEHRPIAWVAAGLCPIVRDLLSVPSLPRSDMSPLEGTRRA